MSNVIKTSHQKKMGVLFSFEKILDLEGGRDGRETPKKKVLLEKNVTSFYYVPFYPKHNPSPL